ncbi:flagellar brake protein [Cohnella pontilimi]|uniref:flagellar brake protein n=1 Tax=Cohnella pontilimi TaxID=2564100 RepID=UPI00145C5AC1|nr:PilZ domain-containing protein [Cohnella pontilimi]
MLPKINQTTYMQLMPVTDPDSATTFRSRVADMDKEFIWLEIPLDEQSRKYHRTHVGDEFRILFFTPEGVKYQFAAAIAEMKKEPVRLIAVPTPKTEQIEREQRRNFLRVEAEQEIAVRIGDRVRFTALTDDVGGGGLSFRCNRSWPLVPGMTLSCWLLLNYRNGSLGHAKFEGEVVRIVPEEPNQHTVMLRFRDIHDSDQQRIIRFCFERQLEKHKG